MRLPSFWNCHLRPLPYSIPWSTSCGAIRRGSYTHVGVTPATMPLRHRGGVIGASGMDFPHWVLLPDLFTYKSISTGQATHFGPYPGMEHGAAQETCVR
jgi:hypothetical protein